MQRQIAAESQSNLNLLRTLHDVGEAEHGSHSARTRRQSRAPRRGREGRRRLRAQLPAAAQAGAARRPTATRSRSSASARSSTRKEAEEQKVAEAVAARLADVEVVIARKVGETEALYGSVTTRRHRRGAGGEGLRDRSPEAAAAPSRSRGSATSTCRSSCIATSRRTIKVRVVAEGAQRKSSKLRRDKSTKSKSGRSPRAASLFFLRPFAFAFHVTLSSPSSHLPHARTAVAERTLPHNLEAERSVLGAILLHNDAFNLAAEVIDSSDFFRDAHRRIFDKMVKLAERGDAIDLVTLKEELGRVGRARRGRRAGLHHRARRRRAALDQRRALRADHQGEGDPPEPDLLGQQDPRDGLRGRGGRRRHPRSGRARDLRDRRRQGARRLRLAARPRAGAASTRSRSCTRARSSSPACRPASPISTR